MKYPRIAVSAVIRNAAGEILLVVRTAPEWGARVWRLPVAEFQGGLDWDKVLREGVLEEIGARVREATFIGIYSDPQQTVFEVKEGPPDHVLFAVFAAEIDPPAPTGDAEWGWFPPDALPSPLLKSEKTKIQDALSFDGEAKIR
jgi:ADP-ribose pyrophosphatase YjhB (NUDIX family)